MPDPFEALRDPAGPVAPDPLFAAHLRARLVRALQLPKGVTVSNLDLDLDLDSDLGSEPETAEAAGAPAATPRAVVPYLIVSDARRALGWYADNMRARPHGEAFVMPDGRIGHAELEIGGGMIYLADEPPETTELAAPRPGDGATVSLTVSVPDVDRVAARAVSGGAVLERPPADHPYGRNAVIRDPFGHRWIVSALAAPVEPVEQPAVKQGDIGYVSLWVPDVKRATEFFGDVLGWTFRPGSSAEGRQVEGLSLAHGLFGGHEGSTLFLCFVVDQVDSAVERVRSAGGHADEPTDEPYGRLANCVDDQGVSFALVEMPVDERLAPRGPRGPRGPENGERNGDVSYVTMEVVDSAKTRAFYGAVLGWEFTPGRVDDGWGATGVVPMVGLHGGHDHATTVPMYRVDEIHGAVERLRTRGGRSTDPVQQPYGLTAECVDDQGTRFYLGQH